jgi:hypothetical protein
MSITTTTSSPSSVRTIWVWREGCDEMLFTIEPHMKIIDNLKKALIGDNRDLYQTVFRGQILSPRAMIPDDIADEDLLELKLYKTGRRKYSITLNHQINCVHFKFLTFSFSEVPTNDDNDNDDRDIGMSIPMGRIDPERTKTMDSNKQMASKLNKWLNKTQSNCMYRRL